MMSCEEVTLFQPQEYMYVGGNVPPVDLGNQPLVYVALTWKWPPGLVMLDDFSEIKMKQKIVVQLLLIPPVPISLKDQFTR